MSTVTTAPAPSAARPDIERQHSTQPVGARPPSYCGPDFDCLAASDPDALATVSRRWAATVGIVGVGRVGVLIAHALACAGIGALRLDDPRGVEATDVGLGAHHGADVGARRASAAASRLGADYASTDVGVGNVGGCDLVVLTSAHVTNPTGTARLICEGVPHLTVTYGAERTDVGPLVLPGRGACVNCVDLHRGDQDPTWPETWRSLRRASVTSRTPQPGLLALTAAAQTAALVLAAVDDGEVPVRRGRPPAETASADRAETAGGAGRPGGAGELDGAAAWSVSTTTWPDLTTARQEWAVHPRCGCSGMAPLPGG